MQKVQHSILDSYIPLIAELKGVLGLLHLRCYDVLHQLLQSLHKMGGEARLDRLPSLGGVSSAPV